MPLRLIFAHHLLLMVASPAMIEQQDVIASFGDAGVLAGIRWAYLSATSRVLDVYSEADGHDATWAGMTRFTLFRDRLDRVFACGRYAVPAGSDAAISLDLLHAELTERDIATMPQLPPGLVVRADLNGSPGWVWQDWRWLLASCAFGKIDELPWSQKASPSSGWPSSATPTLPSVHCSTILPTRKSVSWRSSSPQRTSSTERP